MTVVGPRKGGRDDLDTGEEMVKLMRRLRDMKIIPA